MATQYYRDVDHIRRNATGYFFSPGAMKAFHTHICEGVWGGCYFVTSERMDDQHPRHYTIRKIMPNGSIVTSDWTKYGSKALAVKAIEGKIADGTFPTVQRD